MLNLFTFFIDGFNSTFSSLGNWIPISVFSVTVLFFMFVPKSSTVTHVDQSVETSTEFVSTEVQTDHVIIIDLNRKYFSPSSPPSSVTITPPTELVEVIETDVAVQTDSPLWTEASVQVPTEAVEYVDALIGEDSLLATPQLPAHVINVELVPGNPLLDNPELITLLPENLIDLVTNLV